MSKCIQCIQGKLLASWTNGSGVNPEEVGEYVEGDIRFPQGGAQLTRNGITSLSSRWPAGVIPYVIEGSFSSEDRQMIMSAFNEYRRQTCIRFVPRTAQKDYIVIKSGNTGCWSSVGKTGGPQDVNLQNPGCLTLVGTVIHELMHTVGFMHEQNRWERDSYVQINFANIEPGREYNFEKAAKGTTDGQGVEYDYESVMHYSSNAFSSNGQPTIVSKRSGEELGQRTSLSAKDVMKIRRMYKCRRGLSYIK